jgi:type II secretory pathway predicted ATPase ExeA
MNYLEFYNLKEEPFSNTPDSRFYYNSPQHSKALVRLLYAAESMKGLAVLLGDIGTGKTTLARRMFESLPEEEYEAALFVIVHSDITPEWLLKKIALQMGVKDVEKDKISILSSLTERLFKIAEMNKKAVVLIDEAQMLCKKELMEELRGLLNIESESKKLITFILFGLPELEDVLKMDEPLAHRVALKYRLEPFTEETTKAYIEHRLKLAGAYRSLFEPDTYPLIHRYSRGNPRRINIICDNCLFESFLLKLDKVTKKVVEMVAEDFGFKREYEESPSAPSKREDKIDIELEHLVDEKFKE